MRYYFLGMLILLTNSAFTKPVFRDFIHKSGQEDICRQLAKYMETINFNGQSHTLSLLFMGWDAETDEKNIFQLSLNGEVKVDNHYKGRHDTPAEMQYKYPPQEIATHIWQEKFPITLNDGQFALVKKHNVATGEFSLTWNKDSEVILELLSGNTKNKPTNDPVNEIVSVSEEQLSSFPLLDNAIETSPLKRSTIQPRSVSIPSDQRSALKATGLFGIDHECESGIPPGLAAFLNRPSEPAGALICASRHGKGNYFGVFICGHFVQKTITGLFQTTNGTFILFGDTMVILNHRVSVDIFPRHTNSPENLENRLKQLDYNPRKITLSADVIEHCSTWPLSQCMDMAYWEHLLWLIEQADSSK